MEIDATNSSLGSNFTEEYYFSLDNYGVEILYIVAIIIAVASDITISWTILKYSNMRTRVNIYIVSWCISNTLALMSTSVLALNMFGIFNDSDYRIYCVWQEMMHNQMFVNMAFPGVVLSDWYIMTYCGQNCALRCRRSSTCITASIWILSIIFFVVSTTLCFMDIFWPLPAISHFFGYFVILVFILFIHVMRLIKKKTSSVLVEKNNLELIIVTSFFLCWLPICVTMYTYVFGGIRYNSVVEYCMYIIGTCNSPVLLYLMYRYDKNFKDSFKKLFRNRYTKHEMEDNLNREGEETYDTMPL